MKTSKFHKNIIFYVIHFLALGLISSCSTYHAKTTSVENALQDGNFDVANQNIDGNSFLNKEKNSLLLYLEKGKIEHLKGEYEQSNAWFEKAYEMIDDKIRSSAGQAIASTLTNPMAEPYKGEDFEKVMIHYYKAINYFKLDQPYEAIVEAKRINIKLLEMDEKYKENKNKYTNDAFADILQGIIYESVGNLNDAYISYKNAANLYLENGNQYFGVSLPEQLKKDLVRIATLLDFQDDLEKFKQVFGEQYTFDSENAAQSEVILFWENGLGPFKGQTKITAAGNSFIGSYGGEDNDFVLPIPPGVNLGISAIAIPKYIKRDVYYKRAFIETEDTQYSLEVAEDFYPIATQCLRDRMMRDAIDIAVRFGTKKTVSKGLSILANHFLGSVARDLTKIGTDIAGAVVEKADTRNWQSLPATICYARIALSPDHDNVLRINRESEYGTEVDSISIEFKEGLQIINYFDLFKDKKIYQ